MNVVKTAIYDETIFKGGKDAKHKHTIEQLNNGSIRVTPENIEAQLYLLADNCSYEIHKPQWEKSEFQYDKNWTTSELCAKLIDFIHQHDPQNVSIEGGKKTAIYAWHKIEQSTSDIVITPLTVQATLQLMLMEINEGGNHSTHDMGKKLIELINNYNHVWQWWINLSSNTKTLLLSQKYFFDYYRYGNIQEWQNDRSILYRICSLIDKSYHDLKDLDFGENSLNNSKDWLREYGLKIDLNFNDFSELSAIDSFRRITFFGNKEIYRIPTGMNKMTQLTEIVFFHCTNFGNVSDDEFKLLIDDLFSLVRNLPKLERLKLGRTLVAYYLRANTDVLRKLQSINPDCEIRV